jgi:hypothetical protein
LNNFSLLLEKCQGLRKPLSPGMAFYLPLCTVSYSGHINRTVKMALDLMPTVEAGQLGVVPADLIA